MCLNNPKLFVISGGPGSGKTTVLRELAKLGFQHVPEIARQIIHEQMRAGGSALPWEDRRRYTELMLQRSVRSYEEHTPTLNTMFSDRGIPDTLGYARLIGLGDTGTIESACQRFRYAPLVFVAPPWEEIYTTDGERKQDFTEAVETFKVVCQVYRECGYQLAELPKLAPHDRAEFMLEQIHLTQLPHLPMSVVLDD